MKSTKVSTALCAENEKSLSRWDEMIRRAKERVSEMKRSIRVFEELRDAGAEFPLEMTEDTARAAASPPLDVAAALR